jgi:NAD(P)H-hydrate epimerase
MRILSAQEAREVDRVAMQDQGVLGVTLMENAGHAVAEKVGSMADGGKVGILCGKGNNGGDGYACASFLNEMEIECELISTIPESEITGDARHFYDECKGKGIRFSHAQHVKEVDLGDFNLIVDGLLGTGISGKVKPDVAEWIEAMNSTSSAVLSIDTPSGINGTNGFVCGTAVQATATVTMDFLKQGIVVQPGKSLAGEITVADIGYPASDLPG